MLISKIVKINGMHCASCATIIEKTLNKTNGIKNIKANFATETANLTFDDNQTNLNKLSAKIKPLGYSLNENNNQTTKIDELLKMKNNLKIAIPITILSILVMAWETLINFKTLTKIPEIIEIFFHHLFPILATYIIFTSGLPYLKGLYRFLRYGRANMDTLIGLGTLVAYLYSFTISAFEKSLSSYFNTNHNYYDVVIVVITFVNIGKYLETKAKIKTKDAIEKLLNLQAKTALVIRQGKEIEIPLEQVIHGDEIIVKPGGRIPVDGIILNGSSFVDESMITGEPMPIKKKAKDQVIAGTINTIGTFNFKATKIGSETILAHIVKMVEEAQNSRASIQAIADKISAIFVPIILSSSIIVLIIWLMFGNPSLGLVAFVSILIIACPCALGLATPTAMIVGIGKGANEGILIKDAATLEKLYQVNTIVMDKTGTITCGKPELINFKNTSNLSNEKLLTILTSLEVKSEHPVAKAIIEYAKTKNIQPLPVINFEIIKGQGLKGIIEQEEYFIGNIKLINDLKLSLDLEKIITETTKGKTPIIVANKKTVLGIALIADTIKPETKQAIKKLYKLGINTIMLTGDNKNTAQAIAQEVGIEEIIAEVMPDDKLNKIKEIQKQNKIVAMVGDGINDAPALAQADVGIAMATGTDVAIATAGITLLYGDISKLVKAINLSKLTMRGIKQNLFWAFIYNIINIPLAAGLFYPIFGWLLNPIFAGLAMALSSVSVVANSLRLKTKKL